VDVGAANLAPARLPGCEAWPWWFVTDLQGLHPRALIESPSSFRRRGVTAGHSTAHERRPWTGGDPRLLDDLSAELAARGARAELFLAGGTALAVADDATRATRDLDAVFIPAEPAYSRLWFHTMMV
jgi:hypothetical protein